MIESDLYFSRGVSSSKSEVHGAIQHMDQGIVPGAFCKVLPDLFGGDPEYCSIMHADGAGTKSSLAYIYWKETGDLSVFKGIAIDALVMNLDDLVCVGALDGFVLSNTIGRNKFKVTGDVIATIIEGFEEVIQMMKQHGISIQSCGGETADVGDLVRTLIVDSTLTVRMKRQDLINLDHIKPGDRIIGFESSGKAAWENEYNSGIGSNGLTAARHDLLSKVYAERYPESYSPEIPDSLVYCGRGKLEDPLQGTTLNLGKAILSPTKTYAPLVKKLLEKHRRQIHGFVHCTGGGQTKCLKFGKGIHYIKDNLFPLPPIFDHLLHQRDYSLEKMFPVYNMGHRLEAFVNKEVVDEVIKIAKDCGINAREIGHCEESLSQNNKLTIKHLGKTSLY